LLSVIARSNRKYLTGCKFQFFAFNLQVNTKQHQPLQTEQYDPNAEQQQQQQDQQRQQQQQQQQQQSNQKQEDFEGYAEEEVEEQEELMTRYDPNAEDQAKHLRKPDSESGKAAEKSGSKFWMSQNFSQTFDLNKTKTGSSSSFSLLSKFATSETEQGELEADQSGAQAEDQQEKNPFRDYENDGFEENSNNFYEQKVNSFAYKLKEKAIEADDKIEPYFFTPSDPRLVRESLTFLKLKDVESFSELRANYEQKRPILASIMKKKLKNKAKRAENMSFGTNKNKRKFNPKFNKKRLNNRRQN
jgi:hypothetical protein